MKKRLLSIFTSVSLIASSLSFGASALPTLAGSDDSGYEYLPMIEPEIIEESELLSEGPSAVTVYESAEESNSEFAKLSFSDAVLFSEGLSGEGTEESPYLVGSAADLKTMGGMVNSGEASDAHYKLTSDIDLGGEEWTPIGYYNNIDEYKVSFRGVFDGDGHTVSNFKITEDTTAYLGLFGLATGAEILNVTVENATIDFDSDSIQKTYAGILVGRFITNGNGLKGRIENCKVAGSEINVSTDGSIYGGGIAGSIVAGSYNESAIFLSFLSSECDINVITNATTKYVISGSENSTPEDHLAVAGGIAGYFASQTKSSITIVNSKANGSIRAEASPDIEGMTPSVSQPMAGGVFGDVRVAEDNGNLPGGDVTISSCFSEGTVSGVSISKSYVAGGFAGQLYATENLHINDCYSTADVSGSFTGIDSTGGGFAGQMFYPGYTTLKPLTIINCYALGDVIDLLYSESSHKDSSYHGRFVGYTQSNIYENCYKFESQTVIATQVEATDYNAFTCLSNEEARYLDKYVGFDFSNIWQMDPDAEYFYPTLREKTGYVNFVSEGVLVDTTVFENDGKVTCTSVIPVKSPTLDKTFEFLYWSLTEGGSSFNFESDTVSDDTTLYAVFTSKVRQYTISFMNDGAYFTTPKEVNFGGNVIVPAGIPEKADTDIYYYEFLHWSETDGGDAFDFSEFTVSGDKVFYAVYKEIDKRAWTGDVAESFSSGFGTENDPYIIKTADEFALFAKSINDAATGYTDAHFALGNDINLGGLYWAPIGDSKLNPFSGSFDGRGYSVSNFKPAVGQYIGLFGFVRNGTIKNVNVTNFVIDCSVKNAIDKYPVFIGGLAAYVTSKNGTSTISNVKVDSMQFEVEAAVHYVYAGNIAGYGTAYHSGNTYFNNCYATTPIKAVNTTGYNYVGGIVGRLNTFTGSTTLVSNCYNIGDIYSKSYHSSHAGGLVAYLYSYGKAYTGGKENEGYLSSDEETADVFADDTDIDLMLENSFAIANVYSLSTEYTSYAGYITGECNTYAGTSKIYWPSNVDLSVVADRVGTTDAAKLDTTGSNAKPLATFKNADLISSDLGFDVENTWMFVDGYDYPVLKCMVSDKPVFKVVTHSLGKDGILHAKVQILSDVDSFTVIIGVYNTRNQLIKLERRTFTNKEYASEFELNYSNMKSAKRLSVSAIETSSLKPLFESIEINL